MYLEATLLMFFQLLATESLGCPVPAGLLGTLQVSAPNVRVLSLLVTSSHPVTEFPSRRASGVGKHCLWFN